MVVRLFSVYDEGNAVVPELLVKVKFCVTASVNGTLPKLIEAGVFVDGGINPIPFELCAWLYVGPVPNGWNPTVVVLL